MKDVTMSDHIAVFDLDGTITDCDTYVHFLWSCLKSRPGRLFHTIHLPLAVLIHKAGFRDNSWLKAVFLRAVAAGLRQPELDLLVTSYLRKIVKQHMRPSALAMISHHRENGHKLILATASFDFYVLDLAKTLGFHATICTHAVRDHNQALTGEIQGNNCYGAAKVHAVLAAIPNRENCLIYAYTDHHSDIALLSEADYPFAVCPSSRLRDFANKESIAILEW